MRSDEESQGPVIRDRRRIDPVTGQVRQTAAAGSQREPAPAGGQSKSSKHSVSQPGAASSGQGGQPSDSDGNGQDQGRDKGEPAAAASEGGRNSDSAAARVTAMLAERTADLQRLQAEYANYRKRVERDRMAVREQALANVLNELLPVLDDIGRAREHGELTGAFKSVGESLEAIAVKLGLIAFGESGEPFDPTLHEALMHSYSADVTEPTAVQILQPGYRVGERIIRPARVAVAEPGDDAADGDDEEAGQPEAAAGDDTSAGDGTGEE